MSNHVHFQIQTKKALDFLKFMQKSNLAYFHHYNREYSWVGHFWQDRFKSQAIGKDAYFIQCGKYIELNPVRAKIVKNPEDYKYSSYRYYAEGKPDHLITPDFMYEEMCKDSIERQAEYKKLFIDKIVEESYDKNVWGSDRQRYREQDKMNRKVKKV
jgi:putative transposase